MLAQSLTTAGGHLNTNISIFYIYLCKKNFNMTNKEIQEQILKTLQSIQSNTYSVHSLTDDRININEIKENLKSLNDKVDQLITLINDSRV